jgi:glutamate N-acetyltransferase/amino-acid N-acetyltransferase
MSFFDSRWVTAPAGVRELDGGLPAGFRASGVTAGLKPSGKPDLGLLVCDSETATSAARFTRSGTAAAPVLVTRERCDLDALRGVVANSGSANCATGSRGIDDALAMQDAAAAALGVDATAVAVASTGGIAHYLDMDRVRPGIAAAGDSLSADAGADAAFAAAIMTTDRFEKRVALELELPSGPVRLSAQCKGAGMISPAFATMLCFVQTDAGLTAETADLLLGVTVKRSFDRVSVDGQLSTNDTAILIASGASGVAVEPESDDELLFGEVLDVVLRQLAIMLARDGEGSKRIGRVVVRGGDPLHAERAARAIGNSPLVKTALHGGDPNWGRIAQSVGMAMPDTAPLAFDLAIEGTQVASGGVGLDVDEAALAQAVSGPEVEYEVGLPGDGAEVELFFSDLSTEYVILNSEYTT